MEESLPLAQKLQAIEAYLQSLVAALQLGELPVNLQHISQVFDSAIASIPRLSLSAEKLCEVYNDLPNLLSAYAIDATLCAASYRKTIKPIVFERLYNGNYWIMPLGTDPQKAWLVPNPTRKISRSRLTSLAFAFDWPEGSSDDRSTILLLAPAIVVSLPTAPLTWKLLAKGAIGSYLSLDLRLQNPVIAEQYIEIETMVEQAVAAQMVGLKLQILDQLRAEISATAAEPTNPTQNLGDLWRESLAEMINKENPPSFH
jgi:hypothetical protein